MSKMMKAQVVEAPYKMTLKEVPVPEITDDEVLIKIKYCGICGSDWSIFTGKYVPEKLPLITGHEFFGTVAEAGKNAKGIHIGDRVSADIVINCGTCYYCRHGDGLLCESFEQIGISTKDLPGGFAEYIKVPWKNVYHVPDEVDDYKAAFVEPLTTAIQASRNMDCNIAGSVVIIGSGLGIIHGCLAKLRGAAPIIVIDGNKDRLKMAKEMCADYIIDFTETPDTVAEVKRLTGGIGADYVLEAVGNPRTYEQAFQMVRRGGKVESFGICKETDQMSISPYQFVLHEKRVSGSCAGIGNDWGDAIKLLQYNRIDPTPLISMIVPLEELESALKEIQENKKLVKVLVSPEIKERIILEN
ncbi:zinc-dependent alcohol dehydrogenase [Anaerocolumna xylanovorans]|uniref:Threonine dehydrogenase n=1 Tax=Anaerocolumna xylanovorans DSM 12503 TaxID=1121345 RepID=A0A1M7XW76_9FIRM|nr:alcohol dehydrogenase catalytic domain-containing protein [Anaerocolumna xylanovorans]SHO43013.1 Threonine dehydrogenase [Anaerocolumna xylanovorans DSM 12503]